MRANGAVAVEATAEAEAEWIGAFDMSRAKRIDRGFGGGDDCTPSYYNNEGQRDSANVRSGPYPMAPAKVFTLLADWRRGGHLRSY